MAGTGTSAQILENIVQSPDFLSFLPHQPFGELLEFLSSKFEEGHKLQAEENRTLGSSIFNLGDQERNRSDRKAERVLHILGREILTEYLEIEGGQVWAARTRAGIDFWLSWLRATLNLNQNGISLCSHSKISAGLLLTRRTQRRRRHTKISWLGTESRQASSLLLPIR